MGVAYNMEKDSQSSGPMKYTEKHGMIECIDLMNVQKKKLIKYIDLIKERRERQALSNSSNNKPHVGPFQRGGRKEDASIMAKEVAVSTSLQLSNNILANNAS